jgi:hypothetical protein
MAREAMRQTLREDQHAHQRDHENSMDDAELRAKAREILESEHLQSILASSCGSHFRSAIECFVLDRSTPKGASCAPPFRQLQKCLLDANASSGEFEELIGEARHREHLFEQARANAERKKAHDALTSRPKRRSYSASHESPPTSSADEQPPAS